MGRHRLSRAEQRHGEGEEGDQAEMGAWLRTSHREPPEIGGTRSGPAARTWRPGASRIRMSLAERLGSICRSPYEALLRREKGAWRGALDRPLSASDFTASGRVGRRWIGRTRNQRRRLIPWLQVRSRRPRRTGRVTTRPVPEGCGKQRLMARITARRCGRRCGRGTISSSAASAGKSPAMLPSPTCDSEGHAHRLATPVPTRSCLMTNTPHATRRAAAGEADPHHPAEGRSARIPRRRRRSCTGRSRRRRRRCVARFRRVAGPWLRPHRPVGYKSLRPDRPTGKDDVAASPSHSRARNWATVAAFTLIIALTVAEGVDEGFSVWGLARHRRSARCSSSRLSSAWLERRSLTCRSFVRAGSWEAPWRSARRPVLRT